jgi:hypothetical protein
LNPESQMAEKDEKEEISPWVESDPVCICGSLHDDDPYPEQCPGCETWYVGQCATDNLLYEEEPDYEPYSCLNCEAKEAEAEKAEKAEEAEEKASETEKEEEKSEDTKRGDTD